MDAKENQNRFCHTPSKGLLESEGLVHTGQVEISVMDAVATAFARQMASELI